MVCGVSTRREVNGVDNYIERYSLLITILYPNWFAIAMIIALMSCLLAATLTLILRTRWPKMLLAFGLIAFSILAVIAPLIIAVRERGAGLGAMNILVILGVAMAAVTALRRLWQRQVGMALRCAALAGGGALFASLVYFMMLLAMTPH
jgi:hypothetical protein